MSEGDDIGGAEGDRVLVAEFVLGLLEGEERARMALRIASDPTLRAEQQRWQQQFSGLDGEFAEVAPPRGVLDRVEARLHGTARRTPWWDSLALWRGLAAGGFAVAVVAVGFSLLQPRPSPQDVANQLVAALREEGSSVSFVALYNPATGSVRLTALSGDAVPDKDFELWAIEGSDAPVSMGVISVDQRVERPVPQSVLSGFGAGTILAVTLEPKGGSPTGGPTGPIVAKGAATLI